MNIFQIYRHPTIGAQAVKVGFCWPAFFFGTIWMLVSRLWGWAVLWIVLSVLFIFFGIHFHSFATIIMMVISGRWGNEWRVKNLLSRGFELTRTVLAETKDAAIAQVSKLDSYKDT